MPGSDRIIIVNYKTPQLVIGCLNSLEQQALKKKHTNVIVVDNNSNDNSVEIISKSIKDNSLSDWCQVVSTGYNGGFSHGNNTGIRMAMAVENMPNYIMLLNPDTLAQPDAIQSIIDFMDNHPKVGIAGSRLENEKGGLECSAHTFPSPLGELESGARLGVISKLLNGYVVTPALQDEAHRCDWVSGASMIIRREVIEDIGLLDDGYFLYFEEVDFCKRAKKAGWECWYVPDSVVMHIEGASTDIHIKSVRRPAYWYNSRRRYFVKHYGVMGLILTDLLWSVGRTSYLLRRILRLGAQSPNNDPKWFMLDVLLGDFLSLVSGRIFKINREGNKA